MSEKIERKIKELNKQLEKRFNMNGAFGVKDNEATSVIEEIYELQNSCTHKYGSDNYCEYCGKLKEE